MSSTVIDGSMSALLMDNVSHTINKFATILSTNAMGKYGYAKAFDDTEQNKVVSIKTEDTDLFGISQKVSIVSLEKMRSLLQYIDTTDKGNRLEVFNKMVSECTQEQRIYVNVLCNIKKLTDNQISSPSNSYITMDYFSRDDDIHDEDCPCC